MRAFAEFVVHFKKHFIPLKSLVHRDHLHIMTLYCQPSRIAPLAWRAALVAFFNVLRARLARD